MITLFYECFRYLLHLAILLRNNITLTGQEQYTETHGIINSQFGS